MRLKNHADNMILKSIQYITEKDALELVKILYPELKDITSINIGDIKIDYLDSELMKTIKFRANVLCSSYGRGDFYEIHNYNINIYYKHEFSLSYGYNIWTPKITRIFKAILFLISNGYEIKEKI